MYGVIRFAPGATVVPDLDGKWFEVDRLAAITADPATLVANATNLYERRGDGVFAKVFLVEPTEPVEMVSARELRSLRKDADWLGWLEAAGVDNWQGIDYARELRRNDRRSRMGDPL